MIDISTDWLTRDGRVATELSGRDSYSYPIEGMVEGQYCTWDGHGAYVGFHKQHPLDLISPVTIPQPLDGFRWLKTGEHIMPGDLHVYALPGGDCHRDFCIMRKREPIDLSTCKWGQRLLLSDGTQAIFVGPAADSPHFILAIEEEVATHAAYNMDGTASWIEDAPRITAILDQPI